MNYNIIKKILLLFLVISFTGTSFAATPIDELINEKIQGAWYTKLPDGTTQILSFKTDDKPSAGIVVTKIISPNGTVDDVTLEYIINNRILTIPFDGNLGLDDYSAIIASIADFRFKAINTITGQVVYYYKQNLHI